MKAFRDAWRKMKNTLNGKRSSAGQEMKDKGDAGMNYTVFSAHTIGKSHIRAGMGCEDCSEHLQGSGGKIYDSGNL